MDRDEAEVDMHRRLNEAAKVVTDRNVERLKTANKALTQDPPPWAHRVPGGLGSMERQQPGSRADGGMAPRDLSDPVEVVRNAMDDARRIVANYEKSVIELESKIAELQAKLAGEHDARLRAEKKIEQIVHLCSPL